MNAQLAKKLAEVRQALSDDPDGFVAGDLRPGNTAALKRTNPSWRPYFEFLAVCDGGRFGAVDLWSLEELSAQQERAEDLPGGRAQWLCIGQLLYEPLALEAGSDVVRLFPPGEEQGGGTAYGALDAFLERHLLGTAGYAELVPDADQEDWYRFLSRRGM
jgi:hypothetical protein